MERRKSSLLSLNRWQRPWKHWFRATPKRNSIPYRIFLERLPFSGRTSVSGSSCDSAEKGGDNAGRSYAKPYPPEQMDAHDVSTIVNSAKYDGPECIQPVSDDEIPRSGQLSLL